MCYGVPKPEKQPIPVVVVRKLNEGHQSMPNARYDRLIERINELSPENKALLLDYICVLYMYDTGLWNSIEFWLPKEG